MVRTFFASLLACPTFLPLHSHLASSVCFAPLFFPFFPLCSPCTCSMPRLLPQCDMCRYILVRLHLPVHNRVILT
jgi:hypothetical protein